MTTKKLGTSDADQVLKRAYNPDDASLTINGWIAGQVGNSITQTITTTNVANDTAIFSFKENGTQIYQLTIVYTDATQGTMISATRTA